MNLSPWGKAVIAGALVIAAFFTLRRLVPPGFWSGLIPRRKPVPEATASPSPAPLSSTPSSPPPAVLPEIQEDEVVGLPGRKPGCAELPEVRLQHRAWSSQMGLMFAAGGRQATAGSLMCRYGVNLKLTREEDLSRMREALTAFARELQGGAAQPAQGAHFVVVSGDGTAAFLKTLNDSLAVFGPGYTAKVVGSAGISRGEDKLMGPPAWKANPAASRGGLVAGTLRDGGWNVAQKWLVDNGLCNNPDEETWDSGCLNWVAAADPIDAAEKYVANYCETRPVIAQGQRTGIKKKVCIDAVVTGTPGDATVAKKRGGLVSIVSTREYGSQMPAAIIGIDRWMKDNPKVVEGMLAAVLQGGDQVRRREEALEKAAQVSAEVYGETDADGWRRYYDGTKERDRQGLLVDLGGSSVSNLPDNLVLFGLLRGTSNLFAATYDLFGDIAHRQYPDLMPSYPPADDILDTTYLLAVAGRSRVGRTAMAAAQPAMKPSAFAGRLRNVVSRRAWQINFRTGSADFTPDAAQALEQLLRDLLVASGTVVEVHGHTDNVGSPKANLDLSEARAFAVKQWLEKQSPANFPDGRLRVFVHGQENPVAPNATEAGRARNRRVEIVIGTTG